MIDLLFSLATTKKEQFEVSLRSMSARFNASNVRIRDLLEEKITLSSAKMRN